MEGLKTRSSSARVLLMRCAMRYLLTHSNFVIVLSYGFRREMVRLVRMSMTV